MGWTFRSPPCFSVWGGLSAVRRRHNVPHWAMGWSEVAWVGPPWQLVPLLPGYDRRCCGGRDAREVTSVVMNLQEFSTRHFRPNRFRGMDLQESSVHFGLGTVSPFIDDKTSCHRYVDLNAGTNRWSGAWHLSPPRDVWTWNQSGSRQAGRSRQTTTYYYYYSPPATLLR